MESVDVSKQEPDNGKRMEVANGAKPVDANQDTTEEEKEPVKTLTERMIAIRKDASGIGKENIKMGSYSIKAHTIEGVLHGIRSLFDKHGVWMQPNLVERTYNGNRCDVLFDFYFENVEDADDRKVVRFAGAGNDNSDKGFAKAGTNALKEMLKKVFLITDREDAKEEEDQTEFRSDEGATRAEVDEAMDQAREALERWASSFKSALTNAGSVKEIQRLERENRDQLDDNKLPKVTRDFFNDFIKTRKAGLE